MGIYNDSLGFETAISYITENVRKKLEYIPTSQKADVCEVRLSLCRPLQIVSKRGTQYITTQGKISEKPDAQTYIVTKADIEESFRAICGYSVHTHQNEICNGYITLKGGHRAGLCGTAVTDGKSILTLKDISSINLRIAKQIVGVADSMLPSWILNDKKSLIIAGPPCSGKTTLLRDVARKLSNEGKRVSVVDERGELCAVFQGNAQNDLGNCCDVLNGYPKALGIMMALRVMSPEVIVCDEIGGYEEAQEIKSGLNSGVRFILTAHCNDLESLLKRPQMKALIDSGEFGCVAFLQGGRMIGQPAKTIMLEKGEYENNWPSFDSYFVNRVGSVAL